jgi:hypothetical protein
MFMKSLPCISVWNHNVFVHLIVDFVDRDEGEESTA